MRLHDLAGSGKKICILGFGREGEAMLKAITQLAPDANVTIADANPDVTTHASTKGHPTLTGPAYMDHLDSFDVIIKSPGIPPQPTLERMQQKITTGTQMFFDSIEDTGATVIGITGSKGKSTTSSLIYTILKAAQKDVHLIGNIGKPAIEHINIAKKGTIFVMELSSYQLMNLTVSPHIAVITSFFPEHLDYHGSLQAYADAKKTIARFQGEDDMVFFVATAGAAEIAKEGDGRKIPFSAEDCPLPLSETKLVGLHNASNIAAACAVARTLGIVKDTALAAVRSFEPLPHRLQSIGVHDGIEWIDDAISTTPESTIAALDALNNRVATIILGGQDRGYDFTSLAKRIAQSHIRTIILFPGSGPRIRTALENTGVTATLHNASSMEQAVTLARAHISTAPRPSTDTPIVLLSTASPSYGMFTNFEEKGDQFQACVKRAE